MYYHIHPYRFNTASNKGHKHTISGYTINTIGMSGFHFHIIKGTSSHNGHCHSFSAITGFSIKTEWGHVHKVEGISGLNGIHRHMFEDFTLEEISSNKKNTIFEKIIVNT